MAKPGLVFQFVRLKSQDFRLCTRDNYLFVEVGVRFFATGCRQNVPCRAHAPGCAARPLIGFLCHKPLDSPLLTLSETCRG